MRLLQLASHGRCSVTQNYTGRCGKHISTWKRNGQWSCSVKFGSDISQVEEYEPTPPEFPCACIPRLHFQSIPASHSHGLSSQQHWQQQNALTILIESIPDSILITCLHTEWSHRPNAVRSNSWNFVTASSGSWSSMHHTWNNQICIYFLVCFVLLLCTVNWQQPAILPVTSFHLQHVMELLSELHLKDIPYRHKPGSRSDAESQHNHLSSWIWMQERK